MSNLIKFEVTTQENKYLVFVNEVNDKYDNCTTTNFSYIVNVLAEYKNEFGEIKINNHNVEGVFKNLNEVKLAADKLIGMMETKWTTVK